MLVFITVKWLNPLGEKVNQINDFYLYELDLMPLVPNAASLAVRQFTYTIVKLTLGVGLITYYEYEISHCHGWDLNPGPQIPNAAD